MRTKIFLSVLMLFLVLATGMSMMEEATDNQENEAINAENFIIPDDITIQ